MKEIIKINNDMNKRVLIKDKRVGVRWKIIKMRYSNMFSYGENNEIDFTKMKGIIGIIAPNHYGKSSLLDVIMYCLFDECSRGKMSRDILNITKKKFWCEMIIKINNIYYKIMRKSAKTSKKKVKTMLVRALHKNDQ